MIEHIQNFPYIHFRVTIQSLREGKLPVHKTSMLRGVIARKVKNNVCHDFQLNCQDCQFLNNCIYSAMFESPKTLTNVLNKGGTVPHPFIIRCTEPKTDFKKADELSFEILLLGRNAESFAINLYHVFEEFQQNKLGKEKMQFIVKNVIQYRENNEEVIVFDNQEIKRPIVTKFSFHVPSYKRLFIKFQSPFRIQQKGKLLKEIEMDRFIWQVHHRIRQLNILYDYKTVEPNKELIELENIPKNTYKINDSRWKDILRYSNRKRKYMKLGGVMASIEIERSEQLDKLLPALIFTEKFHLGKATTFGLGQYELWFK